MNISSLEVFFWAVLLPMTAFNLGSYTFSLIFLTLQMHFSLFRFSWSVLQYILFQLVFHQGWDEFKRRILKRIFKSNGVSSWNSLDFFFKRDKVAGNSNFYIFWRNRAIAVLLIMSALLIVPIIFLFFRSLKSNNIQTLHKDLFLNLTSLTFLYVWFASMMILVQY